jgi:hypothetical protein
MSTQLPMHIYEGLCPDDLQPESFDPMCPACRALKEGVAAASRISELEQQLAEAQAKLQQQALEYLSLCGQQDEALRQLEEAKKDAERYRWLRRGIDFAGMPSYAIKGIPWTTWVVPTEAVPTMGAISGAQLDAAIDSAMGEQDGGR